MKHLLHEVFQHLTTWAEEWTIFARHIDGGPNGLRAGRLSSTLSVSHRLVMNENRDEPQMSQVLSQVRGVANVTAKYWGLRKCLRARK